MEHRNCVIRWSVNGLEWLNPPGSKRTIQYDGKEVGAGLKLPQDCKRLGKFTAERYGTKWGSPEVYYNCLITDQYDPPILDNGTGRPIDRALPRVTDQYRVEVYLATRRGQRGAAIHPTDAPTQWKGDGFVTEPDSIRVWKPHSLGGQRRVTQIRPLRQSRLFITYSLHRPITGERHG